MIHLDTSFLIQSLVAGSRPDVLLRKWLGEGRPIAISSIGWTEFLCGPLEPDQFELAHRIVGDCVPCQGEDAATSARLFNSSGRRRGSLIDCMIAAVAVRCDAMLATANLADFRRLEPAGLRLAS